ncbi:hypothetical protein BC826DRAFT_927533 [Russula brevipes]|nr:hypothetical protein BC826DRAFT_927533 [Russula brevipes]
MKTTQTTDKDYKQVENKFKWYMIQDFFYCRALMLYDTERSVKATDQATYVSLAGKIESHAKYAPETLKYCTDKDKLNIPEATVFGTKLAEAVTKYIEFLQETAENKDNDWVVSYVATIPCIQVSASMCTLTNHRNDKINRQSYFYIAVDIAADQSVDRGPTLVSLILLISLLICAPRNSLVPQLG